MPKIIATRGARMVRALSSTFHYINTQYDFFSFSGGRGRVKVRSAKLLCLYTNPLN